MEIIETNLQFNSNMTERKSTKRGIFHNSGTTVRQSIEIIHNYHKNSRGYAGIGYHFYIRRDGSIYKGRAEHMQGAHAYGANSDSIGICFEGKFDIEEMTQEQIASGKEIVAYLREKYGNIEFTEHRKVCNTSCPGTNFKFDEITSEQVTEDTTEPSQNENLDIFHDGIVNCIYDIQEYLNNHYGFNLAQDNIYGNETHKALVKALQTELNTQFKANLVVDGIFGTKTKNARINVREGAEGNITMLIQMCLFIKNYSIDMDKKFGPDTTRIVKQFQSDSGLSADGIVGKNTFEKLFK